MSEEKIENFISFKEVEGAGRSEIPAEPTNNRERGDEESEESLAEDICFPLIWSFAYESPEKYFVRTGRK